MLADENPSVKFAIIDSIADKPNVISVSFDELKGDFLGGAASRTKNMGAAVYQILESYAEGVYEPGAITLDYMSNGVGLTPLDSHLISPDIVLEIV